jgi:hypothetical protein
MVKIAALSLSLILWGCSKIDSIDAPTAISNIQVTDVGSDGDAQFCREFKLKDAEVASYFEKAEEVSFKRFHDELDYLPCFVKGTLQRQGYECEFIIRAGGTAEVFCSGNQQFFYGCTSCDGLFQVGP